MVPVNVFLFFCFLTFLPSLLIPLKCHFWYSHVHLIRVRIWEVIICVTWWRLHLRAALGCLVHKRHCRHFRSCDVHVWHLFYVSWHIVWLHKMGLCCLIYGTYIILPFIVWGMFTLAILQIVCFAINNSVLRLSDGISVRCKCLLFSHWSLLCLWSHRVLFGDWMCCCASSGILLEGGVSGIEGWTMYNVFSVNNVQGIE